MKNTSNPKNDNKEFSQFKISTKIHKPGLLKNLVEKLAERKSDIGYCLEKVQTGWLSVDTSSTEVFVSGDLNISTETEQIYSSFLTNFFFTCTKYKGHTYKLSWINSLS